ncbi:MAG: MarR family transcriptional regulator [Clostridiaceae bacterium]
MNKEEAMLNSMDRVMRILRRRPQDKQHLGRGVYRLLRRINENDGITTRELAELLGMRTSSLNERLSRLEQENIISRERDPKDQRVFIVRLNESGVELLNEINEERRQMNSLIGKILTDDEIEKMTNLAIKLGDGLSLMTEDEKGDA